MPVFYRAGTRLGLALLGLAGLGCRTLHNLRAHKLPLIKYFCANAGREEQQTSRRAVAVVITAPFGRLPAWSTGRQVTPSDTNSDLNNASDTDTDTDTDTNTTKHVH